LIRSQSPQSPADHPPRRPPIGFGDLDSLLFFGTAFMISRVTLLGWAQ